MPIRTHDPMDREQAEKLFRSLSEEAQGRRRRGKRMRTIAASTAVAFVFAAFIWGLVSLGPLTRGDQSPYAGHESKALVESILDGSAPLGADLAQKLGLTLQTSFHAPCDAYQEVAGSGTAGYCVAGLADNPWDSQVIGLALTGHRVTPEEYERIKASMSAGESVPGQEASMVTVPDIVGLDDQQAMKALDALGLHSVTLSRSVDGVQDFHVASTDPPAGIRVATGSSVKVVIATQVTPLPSGATDALACDVTDHVAFGWPPFVNTPAGDSFITTNISGIAESDQVVQVAVEGPNGEGLWHVIRDGSVIAVVDYSTLDGVACGGSGVAGA